MTLNAELSSIRGRLVWPVEALPIHFGTGDIRRNHGSSVGLLGWTEADSGASVFWGQTSVPGKRSGETCGIARGKAKTPTMGGLRFSEPFSSPPFYLRNRTIRRRGDDGLLPLDLGRVCGRLPEDFEKEQQRVAGQVQTSRSTAHDGVALLILLGPLGEPLRGYREKPGARPNARIVGSLLQGRGSSGNEPSSCLHFVHADSVRIQQRNQSYGRTHGLAIGCTVTAALTYGIMACAAGNYLISDYLRISSFRDRGIGRSSYRFAGREPFLPLVQR